MCDEQDGAVARLEQAFGDAVVQEIKQLVVEAIDVEKNDGLLVQFQRLPGEDLEHFFEGAEATGEDEEGVGEFAHHCLAGVHGAGNVELGNAVVGNLEIDEHFRDDTDDPASGCERRFSQRLHKADVGSAVDDADVLLCKDAAEFDGGFAVDTVSTVR